MDLAIDPWGLERCCPKDLVQYSGQRWGLWDAFDGFGIRVAANRTVNIYHIFHTREANFRFLLLDSIRRFSHTGDGDGDGYGMTRET